MIKTIYPKLFQGLSAGKQEVREECLEILAEIFKKFGSLLYKKSTLIKKEDMMAELCKLLSINQEGVRKRATICIG